MKVTSALSSLPPVMEFLGGIAMAAALWYGSHEIAQGRLTTGAFASFIAALFLSYGPAKKLSRVNANLQQAIAAAGRIFEMLDTHSEVIERPGAVPMAPLSSGVAFRHVSFHYEDRDRRRILRDVSFEVPVGQMVAIVGLSGAGKTTLVNLIPRFYDVTGGAILVDGVDIRDVTIASLRAQIGMVTQDTVLFDDTVAANIAYGSPGASKERIEAAARAAHAHEFVATLPDGYETRIGERGQRLSGGQRQRLAIARALLKDPPILVLDEATSSLDAESEHLVQDALLRLMENRTSFVIAHRLSTVRRADAIIVLERGVVREVGRHDELLARPNGVYARLYSLQMFENGAAAPGATSARPRTRRLPRPPRPTPPRAFHDHVDDRVCQRHARGGERDDQRHGQERQPSLPRRAAARAVDARRRRERAAHADPAAAGARPRRSHRRRADPARDDADRRARRGVRGPRRRGDRAGP